MRQNAWASADHDKVKRIMAFSEEYKKFLDSAKTEREAIDTLVNEAEAKGYRELSALVAAGGTVRPGDRVYSVWMNKSIVLFRIGTEKLENGMNILGAHIDSPRLDVKQNPLYEEGGFAYLDTHYYGGIKKYLYVATPLALHGVVVKKDGTTVILSVGEDEDEPVFFVSDLLIHLSQELLQKTAAQVVEGEALDLIIGSRPFVIRKEEKEEEDPSLAEMTEGQRRAVLAEREAGKEKKLLTGAVRRGILSILYDEYGFEEDDFLSAELEIVPAGKARDAGFDRSMVLAYGQDDRVCAYPSFRAMDEAKEITRTACCILVDKEEIGSVGATGMQSRFFENAVAELLALAGEDSGLALRRCLANSCMLSSDVCSAFDPVYASAFEKKNVGFLGEGLALTKYTGSRGKSGSNDANAEYIAHLRRILDDRGIRFQTAELGRVDLGGGGTIAYILAKYGMNVIDCGVPVLNMHALYEVTSKADIYELLLGYVAFLEEASLRS